jgi:DNA-binding GntR family transcriptional regulator
MVKHDVADKLREQILRGSLGPGEKIVELQWAAKLKVAQTSVREALNILNSEGFVRKTAGRCAEVIDMTPQENWKMFQVRIALESLAARLIAEGKPDLSELEQVLADMRAAAKCNNTQAFYERDTRFHLLFAEKSGNPTLYDALRRIVVPLIAFDVARVNPTTVGPQLWTRSIQEHKEILDAVRTLAPAAAQQFVESAILKFAKDNQKKLIQNHSRRQSEDSQIKTKHIVPSRKARKR